MWRNFSLNVSMDEISSLELYVIPEAGLGRFFSVIPIVLFPVFKNR